MVAVGLEARAEDPRAADHAVVRMACLVPVPGGVAGVRQDAAHGDRLPGRHLAPVGGVPTYALTDNEKTVTTEHIARIAVRHPDMVEVGRHYGLTIRTCVPADPQSKGGSEATVRIAKADLVPTEANLLGQYSTFGELETACREFCEQVNAREHRVTRRAPVEALAEERQRLHPLPSRAFTSVFGQTRRVNWDGTVQLDSVRYSVPHQLIDTRVWVRQHGEEVICDRRRRARARRGRPASTRPGWASRRSATRTTRPAPTPQTASPRQSPPRRPRSCPSAPAPPSGCSRPPAAAPNGSDRRWPTRSPWPNCTAPTLSTGR